MFNIKKYREIKDFLQKSNKNAKIIAISKNHPLESVEEAVRHGVYIFGEKTQLKVPKYIFGSVRYKIKNSGHFAFFESKLDFSRIFRKLLLKKYK